MQLQGILDDACLEKLRQGPPRWHKLSQTLEELWSRKRGRDAHRSGADGALGQLHKLLHPQEHGTRAAASTADSGEGTDDDEAQGGDPIARGQTAVNAATRKLSRKKGFLVYCSNKVIDHYEHPRNVGSFDKGDEAKRIEDAVEAVLADGLRTADLMGPDGGTPVSTTAMGDAILAKLDDSD